MSLRSLLEAVKEFLEEDLKEMRLPIKNYGDTDSDSQKGFDVFRQKMPDAEDVRERVPYILLQILNGADELTETGMDKSTVHMRAIIVIYDPDPEEGSLALMNVIEKIRMDLLRTGVIGGRFEIKKPLEFLMYQEETNPYHIGEMSMIWRVQGVDRFTPQLMGFL